MVEILETHRYLLEGTVDVVLTTLTKNGFPHSFMIWCSYDGEYFLLNTGVCYMKEKNIRLNPNVSVVGYESTNLGKWISINGTIYLVEEKVVEHLNQLCIDK